MRTRTTITATLLTIGLSLAAAACGAGAGGAPGDTAGGTRMRADHTAVRPVPTTADRPTATVDGLVPTRHGRMHLRCVGAGTTTVLLVAGWDSGGETWGAVEPSIAQHARVCSYARFGTGTSDAPTATQTFATQAADLHALLDAAGEPGPYVVLGHSFGGATAVTFASEYPGEVRGLVLLDATPTTWPETVCSVPAYQAVCTLMHDPGQDAERLDVFPAFERVATVGSLGDVRMTVVTAAHRDPTGLAPGELDRLDARWRAGQRHWAALSTRSRVVTVADTGHHIELDQPQVVVDEVVRVLT